MRPRSDARRFPAAPKARAVKEICRLTRLLDKASTAERRAFLGQFLSLRRDSTSNGTATKLDFDS